MGVFLMFLKLCNAVLEPSPFTVPLSKGRRVWR